MNEFEKLIAEVNDSKYKLYIDGDFDCFLTIVNPSDIGKAIDSIKKDFPNVEVRLEKITHEQFENWS